jgi:hypothetical protein
MTAHHFAGEHGQWHRRRQPHRRHNGRPRTIGQLCCSIARKGVRYLRRCRTGGNDPAAKPVCGTPRAERHAAAVVALRCYSRQIGESWGASPRSRTSALSPLGDWARGKRLRMRSSSRRQDTRAGRRSRPCGNRKPKQQPTYIPVAAGIRVLADTIRLKLLTDLAERYAYGLYRQQASS